VGCEDDDLIVIGVERTGDGGVVDGSCFTMTPFTGGLVEKFSSVISSQHHRDIHIPFDQE